MSKTLEATLADHRSRQRAALLAAAQDLLLEGGYAAMTFSALGSRTSLARATVYSYFRSRDDLVAAVCEEVLPEWLQSVQEAVAAAEDPLAQIAAYAHSQLALAANGRHRLGQILADAPLGPDAKARIRAIHTKFESGALDALRQLGVSNPELIAAFVQAVVSAATKRISEGEQSDEIISAAGEMITAGVNALAVPAKASRRS